MVSKFKCLQYKNLVIWNYYNRMSYLNFQKSMTTRQKKDEKKNIILCIFSFINFIILNVKIYFKLIIDFLHK